MATALDMIVRELNPLHDYDRLVPMPRDISLKEKIIHKGKNTAIYVAQLPKHIIRGGVVGGTVGGAIGTVVAAVSGDSPLEGLASGAVAGASAGMLLDFGQYVLRTIYYKLRYNLL